MLTYSQHNGFVRCSALSIIHRKSSLSHWIFSIATTDINQPPYLYLTTIGRKTGKRHEIEIWFVEHGGSYYLVSEFPERSDWVRNIRHNSDATIRVGTRDAEPVRCTGRLVDRTTERTLGAAVARLMDAKYNWSDGQIVELRPAQ